VQYVLRPGVIEFRSGHPDLGLLPAQGLLEATRIVVEREPQQALSYGAEQGPGCLIRQLQAWLEREEGVAPPVEQLMITGGASQALDMCCMILTRPGDTALVQSPTYHLALRVLRDHQLDLVPVASDGEGLRLDVLEKTLLDCQATGRTAKLLYLVATFNNPSGASMSMERRKGLALLAQRFGLMVIEDDVYHQLWYDRPPPPSVYHLASEVRVVRLGSFSKILAPGLRLGWMSAPSEIIERCKKSGVLDSGGGLGHFTAHVVAAFMERGLLDQHIETLRATYQERLNGLIQGMEKHVPASCSWLNPGGGFFLWLRLPAGLNSPEVLPVAEEFGVSFLPGPPFYVDAGGEAYCRLNFTLWSLQDIAEGTRRLGRALQDCLKTIHPA
jgi:DNA-binding transcriptional MocR family regulator